MLCYIDDSSIPGQPKAYSTQPSKEKHVKSWEFDQKGGLNPKVQVRISPLQIPVFQFCEKKSPFSPHNYIAVHLSREKLWMIDG